MARRCPECRTEYPNEISFCGNDGTITIEVLPEGEVERRLGERLGQYMVVARIADGAMGRVYEGRHLETKDRVAIKVLHADVARDNVAVERFKREADTARELAHPNVVRVIDFGQTEDGSYFMTMEYLQGEELGQLLRRGGKVPAPRIVRILGQLATGLDHAHSFGVVHRDLKPDNIFLCESDDGDVVKILDFGSVKLQMDMGGAKLTAFGTTLGSPYYMSPEQAMGKQDVDHRTDVFAMGAILFEMLTGKTAFEAPNIAAILMKILSETPPAVSTIAPGNPPALDDVVEKALRKDKNTRYASAGELANAAFRAFGLQGDTAEWRKRSMADIATALGQAVPPPPRPFGVTSIAPQPAGAKPAKGEPTGARRGPPPPVPNPGVPRIADAPTFTSIAPPPRSGPPMLAIAAGVGLVVLVAIAYFVLRG